MGKTLAVCPLCTLSDASKPMVQCDQCKQWHHFDCVGVDESIRDQPWSCSRCVGPPIPQKAAKTSSLPPSETAANSLKEAGRDELVKELERVRTEREALKKELKKKNQVIKDQRENLMDPSELKIVAEERDLLAEKIKELTISHRAVNKDRDQQAEKLELLERQAMEYDAMKRMMNEKPPVNGSVKNSKSDLKELLSEASSAINESVQGGSKRGSNSSESRESERRPTVADQRQEGVNRPLPLRHAVETSNNSDLATLIQLQSLEDLPKFSGGWKDWPLFIAAYERDMESVTMTERRKLARLEKALCGEARELVLGRLTYSKKADEVIDALKHEYGRSDVAAKRLTEEMLKIPSLTHQSRESLKELAIKVSTFALQMKTLNREAELKSEFLLDMLCDKLIKIPALYKKWKRMKSERPHLDVGSFAKFVEEERTFLPPSCKSESSTSGFSKQSELKRTSKTHNAHASDSHDVMYHQPRHADCAFCGAIDSHEIYRCPKFKKAEPLERFRFAQSEKLCFSCLSDEHLSPACERKRKCGIEGCDREHHSLLHLKKRNASAGKPPRSLNPVAKTFQPNNGEVSAESDVRLHHQVHQGEPFELTAKVVAVRVHGREGRFVDTYAFLDDGSTITMMERRISDLLDMKGERENLRLRWTKGIVREEDALRCDVQISGISQRQVFEITNMYCVNGLELAAVSQNGSDLAKRYKHLKGLPLPDFNGVTPEILIGLDHATFLNGTRVIQGKCHEPLAAKTKLGWIVYGRQSKSQSGVEVFGKSRQQRLINTHTRLEFCERVEDRDRNLHELVKHFFSSEAVGMPQKTLKSQEETRAEKIVTETLNFTEGRYEVGLLWAMDNISLPDCHQMAMKRLVSEERKLRKDPDSLDWMNSHVRQLLTKEYARKATDEDLMGDWPRIWICPMFTVVNRNKIPPKRRCVADTAAKVGEVSLNSKLLKGPDNLIMLTSALCRAREQRIMVTADVAEMFHQIRITKEDQQCQRFLWRDGNENRKPEVFIMQAMMFGPTCSPSVAQKIKNLHAEKYRSSCPEAVEALQNYMYVDDYFNSHATEEEATRVTKDAVTICAKMSFDLVQVQSNCEEMLRQLPERHVKKELVSLNLDDGSTYTTKILGMHWRPQEDVLVFKRVNDDLLDKMANGYCPTKREALSALMKVFDPLGLAAKFIVRGKWIMQDIWRECIGWDEKIPNGLAEDWLKFLATFDTLEKVSIPRWYAPVDPRECLVELITFVDSSDKAYAAVSYFRMSRLDEVYVALVMAKTKVAPLKPMSIPRLELEAARLGARLAKTIADLHTFSIARKLFLSDSKCTLAWIQSSAFKFKPFVAHRVGEILELTESTEWRYVPSAENVADDATKVNKDLEDEGSSRWYRGPPFLQLKESEWPIENCKVSEEERCDRLVQTHVRLENLTQDHPINRISPRFRSSWVSLCNVMARIMRVTRRTDAEKPDYVTAEEFHSAEDEVFSVIQRESFSVEWNQLFNWSLSQPKEKFNDEDLPAKSPLRGLQPKMCEGERMIRLTSRDRHSARSYAARNVIVLPKSHELVRLYLYHLHSRNMHFGIETTIADSRERVWIFGVRQALGSVIADCQLCKNRRAQPSLPTVGSLHEARTAFDLKPFSHVGVDCFGPMDVKLGRGTVKRWGVLFTCLAYRAIHVELLLDLSADRLLNAVRGLMARRGRIIRMYSDNGKNFVGAVNTIARERVEKVRLLGETATRELDLDWRFIPAYSPWMGGAWERLIGLVKRCIKFTLKGETPTEDVLRSALVEAELIVNKRPVTHTPIDPDDDEPLTPNLALFGSSDSPQTLGNFEERDEISRSCRRRVLHLCEKFRRRWEREYLPTISTNKNSQEGREVELGDVVLLAENEESRDNWKMGRIIKIYPSTDGGRRIVDVKMGNGSVKYRRSVGNLAVLDLKSTT